MPLDPFTVGTIMKGFMTANLLIGTSSSQLAAGVAGGLSMYGKSGMNVATIDVGTLGVGKGFGAGVFISPPTFAPSFTAAFAAAGIRGISAPQLISALSMGFSQALALATINTIHPGVGLGTGQLVITPNPPVAIATFIQAFASAGMTGPMAANAATAIANGLDRALPLARGIVAIAGPPNIVPGAGVGSGKLL